MYVALLLSLSFATISTVASVFNFVIQQNGFSLPESLSGSGHVLLALAALTNLFDAWSTPLLFLSICLLIRDRHLALQKARAMNFFPIGFYALFALSLIFGTTSASLYLDYLSILYFGRFRNHTIAWLNHKIVLYLDLTYTFSSLWYFSAGVTLLYAAFVYREMRCLSLNDKVSDSCTSSIGRLFIIYFVQVLRYILFGVAPAYVLLAVESMIFTILTSPSGIKVNPLDAIQVESINFTSVFLGNFFHTIIYGIMVGIGLSRKLWYAEPADMIPREFLFF